MRGQDVTPPAGSEPATGRPEGGDVHARRAWQALPDALGWRLARVAHHSCSPALGSKPVADPRAAWLDQDRSFVQNGDYASGQMRRQADAIFFIEEVNAVGRSGG